jgi:hypothetical protein
MTATWAVRLAPEPFRDFLPYASPSALQVIHAPQVLKRALEVAQRFSQPSGRERHAAALEASFAAAGLDAELGVSKAPAARLEVAGLDEAERRVIGQRVLALYFHLLHWHGPLFLDLRPRHLTWSAEEGRLLFHPTSLWCRPDADFMGRLRSLYAGFYEDDVQALEQGIELYKWQCEPTPGFAQRIRQLLRAHFGPADATAVTFSIAHFRSTFDAIFKEAAASRARLHPDLTFLGVELVGLYLTLESVGVPLDARAEFERARGR